MTDCKTCYIPVVQSREEKPSKGRPPRGLVDELVLSFIEGLDSSTTVCRSVYTKLLTSEVYRRVTLTSTLYPHYFDMGIGAEPLNAAGRILPEYVLATSAHATMPAIELRDVYIQPLRLPPMPISVDALTPSAELKGIVRYEQYPTVGVAPAPLFNSVHLSTTFNYYAENFHFEVLALEPEVELR